MDLRETWNELQQQSFAVNIFEEDSLEDLIHRKSASPLARLRRQVLKKIWFVFGFVGLFLLIMPFINQWLVQVLLLFCTLVYVIGGIVLWQEYQLLKKEIVPDGNLLAHLQSYYQRVKNILKYEELVGLILYPISATMGFLWSFTQKRGLEEVVENNIVWMTLVILLVVITPLCHWLARWMNRKAFGKYLDRLEENIEALQSE